MPSVTDVAIIGAGPYGLSLAAHLYYQYVSVRVFGEPMKFWRDMPAGINLKSFAFATNIYVPEAGHTFPEWCRKHGLEDFEPCTMQSFSTYGVEIQKRFVPDLEEVNIIHVEQCGSSFELSLATGEVVKARRVVVATGLSGLSKMPDILSSADPKRVRHTSTISDYTIFRNMKIAVIGGGASAIEAGALVNEAGGTAEVFIRAPNVVFHDRSPKHRPIWKQIKEPISVLGASRQSWVLQHLPLLVHFMPEARRIRFSSNYLGPSSPWWIKDRVIGKVPLYLSHELQGIALTSDGVRLEFREADGQKKVVEADCVIAGTGYHFDIAKLGFLSPKLEKRVERTGGAPSLNLRFETSVPGLHFIGPLSFMSFGPLFRFVAGADFTARNLSRQLKH